MNRALYLCIHPAQNEEEEYFVYAVPCPIGVPADP